jgi:hypothetical protein
MQNLLEIARTVFILPLIGEIEKATQEGINQAAIDRGIGFLEAARAEYPQATEFLLALLYQKPKTVLKRLGELCPAAKGLQHDAHAVAYVEQVQTGLKAKNWRVQP